MGRLYRLALTHCLTALAGQVIIVSSFWVDGFDGVLAWPPAHLLILSPLPNVVDGLLLVTVLTAVIAAVHYVSPEVTA